MKQLITTYLFSTSGKTITLSDYGASHPVDLKRLYLITDVTTNKILYNFADSTVATAAISSNNVITLSALQGGESNSDALQIVYEVLNTDPTYETPLLPANAAQETGGNLASIKSDLDTVATNTTGVATASNQTTGNTSLSTIATNTGNIPAKGQATMANSTPVVLASNQSTVPVTDSAAESSLSTIATNTGNTATDVASLTSSSAGGYVRQDSTATIAKESGGNLAGAKTDLDTIAGTVSGG
jgi:hypothetical protein